MRDFHDCGTISPFIVLSIEQGNILDLDTLARLAVIEAESSLTVVLETLPPTDGTHTGGYLCVARINGGRTSILAHDPIGVIPPGKVSECRRLSLENVERLIANARHQPTGRQLRDYDANRLTGTVLASSPLNIVAGFSGLPDLANEALILHWMVMLDLLTWEETNVIALVNGNEYFRRIPVRAFYTKAPRE